MEVLRFLTAGSVDDGKSTLIGRLLHDAHAVYQDQLAAVYGTSAEKPDFSLLTDGLKAEREQGITIDVAYRYFATAKRKFIVADVPGHEQYTRNMATGASTARLAVLLVDARKGLLTQTTRHAAIAWLMGIRNFAVVINKMDLAGFSEDVFRRLEGALTGFFQRLGEASLAFIPCCAPEGDNVVRRSAKTPWYAGPSLLEHLETTPVAEDELGPLRFPVQIVTRRDAKRFYAGRVASGMAAVGDRLTSLPSGRSARITAIRMGEESVQVASAPLSVAIQLDTDLDIGRGDLLCHSDEPPTVTRRFAATVLWMAADPLVPNRPYLLKHTSRQVCGTVTRIAALLDPATLERRPAESLQLNEFGEVEVETHQPICADVYTRTAATGRFIVIDPISNETVGAGMISDTFAAKPQNRSAGGASAGMVVWLTGLSSAGKSTIAQAVYEKLWAAGRKVELLDGDIVRQHLSKNLGFSKADRDENIARIGFVAELLARNGVIAIVAAISPYEAARQAVRDRVGNFLEVYVHAPMPVLEERDRKGIYRRCRSGEIHGVSGIDDPYEPPVRPEVECRTDHETIAQSAAKVVHAIEQRIAAA